MSVVTAHVPCCDAQACWDTCFGLEGSRIPGVPTCEALPAVSTLAAVPRLVVWKELGWIRGRVNLSAHPSDIRREKCPERGGAWRRRGHEEVARALCCPTVSTSVHISAF